MWSATIQRLDVCGTQILQMTVPAGVPRKLGRRNLGPNVGQTISREHLELCAHQTEVGQLNFKVLSRVNGIHILRNEGVGAGQKVKFEPGTEGELFPGDIIYLDETLKLLIRMPPKLSEQEKEQQQESTPPETQSTQIAEDHTDEEQDQEEAPRLRSSSSSSSAATTSSSHQAQQLQHQPSHQQQQQQRREEIGYLLPLASGENLEGLLCTAQGHRSDPEAESGLRSSRKRVVEDRITVAPERAEEAKRSRGGSSPFLSGISVIRYSDLKAVDLIGKGTCSNVFRASWNGTEVAVKRIFKSLTSKALVEGFEVESSILFRLRHPNVVTLFGVCDHNGQLLLVTELLARGSLRDILDDEGLALPWAQRLSFVRDAAAGMHYLHTFDGEKAILHRDVKSANFLVAKDWTVKVGDFGISRVLDSEDELRQTFCGTLAYCAPEILLRQPYTLRVDVFSFGIVMWEVLTRKEPFVGVPPAALLDAVTKTGRRPPIDSSTLERYPKYCDLLVRCLFPNPDLRPTFKSILQSISEIVRVQQLTA